MGPFPCACLFFMRKGTKEAAQCMAGGNRAGTVSTAAPRYGAVNPLPRSLHPLTELTCPRPCPWGPRCLPCSHYPISAGPETTALRGCWGLQGQVMCACHESSGCVESTLPFSEQSAPVVPDAAAAVLRLPLRSSAWALVGSVEGTDPINTGS